MKKYLYLLTLCHKEVDDLHLFYAIDEQEAQQIAEYLQKNEERRVGEALQRIAFRTCPHGFTTGMRTYYPPTQEASAHD